jgi:hypothetical protein
VPGLVPMDTPPSVIVQFLQRGGRNATSDRGCHIESGQTTWQMGRKEPIHLGRKEPIHLGHKEPFHPVGTMESSPR